MLLRFALLLCAGLVLGSTVCAQTPTTTRTDGLGDQLPDGAVARLGTLRLKHNFSPMADKLFGRNFGYFISTISDAVFSGDGKKIATLGSPNVYNLRVWDATNGKELPGPWTSYDQRGSVVAFSADGNTVAVSGINQQGGIVSTQITIWDVAGAKLLQNMTFPYQANGGRTNTSIRAMVFADDGKTMISAGNGSVRWWDLAAGKQKREWKPIGEEALPYEGGTKTKSFANCTFSPGAKFLSVQVVWRYAIPNPNNAQPKRMPLDDQESMGFDVASGKARWRTVNKPNLNVQIQFAFSADDKWAASAVGVDTVELRVTASGKLVDTLPAEGKVLGNGRVSALALATDRTLAIRGSNEPVLLWNPAERANFRSLPASSSPLLPRGLAFSPDDKTLLATGGVDIQLYDVATLKERFSWEGHRSHVDAVAFSADGERLLTGNNDSALLPKELITWDTARWKSQQVSSLHNPPWPNIGVTSFERTFYVGKEGNERFSLFDFTSGKQLGRFAAPSTQTPVMGGPKGGFGSYIPQGFFSPGSKFFVLPGQDNAGKASARVYAVPSCKMLCELPALGPFELPVSSRNIAFSADGKLVAVVGENALVHICETAGGKVRHRVGRKALNDENRRFDVDDDIEPSSLAFSPDGKLLASWIFLDESIQVWDVATGKRRLEIPPDFEHPRGRVALAWSPDARTLAVGDRKIQLWEVASGKVRRELDGHQGAVRSLAYSPDGRLLASGSTDTTVLIWEVR